MNPPAPASCLSCGYSLEGIAAPASIDSPELVCPECATSVAWSLGGDLRFSAPTHLCRLRRGARLLLWGFILFGLAVASGGALAIFWSSFSFDSVDPFIIAGLAAIVVVTNLWVAGWFLLASTEQSREAHDRRRAPRFVARFAFTACMLGQFAAFIAMLYAMFGPGAGSPSAGALLGALAVGLIAAGLFLCIASLATYVAGLLLIRDLARRMRDLRLRRRAGLLLWLSPLLIAPAAGLLWKWTSGFVFWWTTHDFYLAGAVALLLGWFLACVLVLLRLQSRLSALAKLAPSISAPADKMASAAAPAPAPPIS